MGIVFIIAVGVFFALVYVARQRRLALINEEWRKSHAAYRKSVSAGGGSKPELTSSPSTGPAEVAVEVVSAS